MLIDLYVVYGCFCTPLKKSSSCGSELIANKALRYLLSNPLQTKFADPWFRGLSDILPDCLIAFIYINIRDHYQCFFL